MKRSKGLSLKTTTALILIIIILGVGGTMWYYALYKVAYRQNYDMEVKVENRTVVGFNADPTLHFGILPTKGGIAKKNLVVRNDWDIPLRIEIRIKGDIAPFVSVDDNGFTLDGGDWRPVMFYVEIPKNHPAKVYTGTTSVTYIRP